MYKYNSDVTLFKSIITNNLFTQTRTHKYNEKKKTWKIQFSNTHFLLKIKWIWNNRYKNNLVSNIIKQIPIITIVIIYVYFFLNKNYSFADGSWI